MRTYCSGIQFYKRKIRLTDKKKSEQKGKMWKGMHPVQQLLRMSQKSQRRKQ